MADEESDIPHPAKPDITVALKIQLEDATKSIIGYLVAIDQESLVVEYLPLDSHVEDFTNMQCEVIVKPLARSGKTSFSAPGTIEQDESSPIKSRFGVQSRRCKVVFSDQVQLSEIQPYMRNTGKLPGQDFQDEQD